VGDAVQGEAAALVEGVDPAERGPVAELAAAATDSPAALAAIDADNASALDVQEPHQLVQVEAFAAAEVAASLEVDALVEEAELLLPLEELRAMDSA